MKKTSLVFLLLMSALQVRALESHYVVNQVVNQPASKDGSLEIDLQKTQENFSENGWRTPRVGSRTGNAMKLVYTNPLSEVTSLGIGAQFLNTEYTSDTNGQSQTVTGLGDFSLNLKSGIIYDTLTLTYGANAGISPGPAQTPYTRSDLSKAPHNNFSGTQSLSPFVGVESYIHQIAVGGKFTANIFSAQYLEENGDSNLRAADSDNSFRLEGFAEFPIFRKVDFGVVVGAGRKDLNISKYYQGGNEYLGQVYTQYKFDKETSAIFSISSQSVKIPTENDSTDFTIGLRRSL